MRGLYPCSAGRRDVVIILFVSQLDAMSAQMGHSTQGTLPACIHKRRITDADNQTVVY